MQRMPIPASHKWPERTRWDYCGRQRQRTAADPPANWSSPRSPFFDLSIHLMVTRKSEGQRSRLVRIIKKYHKRALADFFRGQREDQLQEMMLGENLAPATVAMY